MKISMVSIERDGIVKLAVEGNATASDFLGIAGKNPIEPVLGPNWANFRVLIDMSRVPYIDSSAIGWFINSQKSFKTAGGALALYGVQPSVRQVLELLRVGRIVPFTDTEQAARAALDTPPTPGASVGTGGAPAATSVNGVTSK